MLFRVLPGMRRGVVAPVGFSFPKTASRILAAAGTPSGWTTDTPIGAYLCDAASPLVDSLGIGPNLVTLAGSPAFAQVGWGRGKKCLTLTTVADSVGESSYTGYMSVAAGTARSVFVVCRELTGRPSGPAVTVGAGPISHGWYMLSTTGPYHYVRAYATDTATSAMGATCELDEWVYAAAAFDGSANTVQAFSSYGTAPSAPYNGSDPLTDPAWRFTIGAQGGLPAVPMQIAAIYCFAGLLTADICAALWASLQ